MKKTYLAAMIAAALAAAPASAFDYGGTADNTLTFKFPSAEKVGTMVTDIQGLTGWLRQPLNESGTSYIAAEATMQYKFSHEKSAGTNNYLWFDVGLLKYAGMRTTGAGSQVQVSLGRFNMADATGIILDQAADGAYLSVATDRYELGMYGSYTGALNRQFTTMIDLQKDGNGATLKNKAPYYFASPYALALINVQFPYLFLNQTVTAEMLGAFGTDGPNGNNVGYNRVYATAGLNGPILRNLVYTVTTSFANYTDATKLSNLTQAFVTFYPDWRSSSVTASFLYASGDTDGTAEFKGFTSKTATLAFSEPEYTDLIMGGLAFTVKPVPPLLANAGLDLVWNGSGSYQGIQFNTGAQWQLFTDLLVSASLGTYIGDNIADGSNDGNTSMTFHAIMSF